MAGFVDLPLVGTLRFDRTLAGAIQAVWDELMPTAKAGSIQVEYRIEGDGFLQYVKIFASRRHLCVIRMPDSLHAE